MIEISHEERGQTAAEYAVVLGLISIGLVLALTSLGATIGAGISRAASLVTG